MDSKINCGVIAASIPFYSGKAECPIDIEFTLPDYCPDIKRILKCTARSFVLSNSFNGDTLEVSGVTKISVLYVDEQDGEIFSCETSDRFITQLRPDSIPDMPRVSIRTLPGYVNCRAASGRRLDVHGSFAVAVSIEGKSEQSVIIGTSGDGIEAKTEQMIMSDVTGFADKVFTVSEVLELQEAKPPILTVLRSSAVCCLSEIRPMQGKVIIKGDLFVDMLYRPDNGEEIQQMRFSLPVSQILDTVGVDEDSLCDARLKALSCELKPMNDVNGEMRLVSCEAKLSAELCCYSPKQISLVTDAYSTEYEVVTESCKTPCQRVCDVIKSEELLRVQTALPEGTVKITDVWCDEPQHKCRMGDDGIIFDITLRLCLLGSSAEGLPLYFEKELNGEYNYDADCEGSVKCDADFIISDVSYSMADDNKLDLRLMMRINGIILQNDSREALISLSVDEQSPKEASDCGTLCLYYADEGEQLWDIAKSHNTSCGKVREENSLSSDILSGGMLMIPMRGTY